MGLWKRIVGLFRRKKSRDIFEAGRTIQTSVSEVEFSIYRLEADRNGMSLQDWMRETLNRGVSRETLRRLSSGSGQAALNMAYQMLDEEDRLSEATDTAPVLPLAPRRPMYKKLSGHPCFHLSAEIPKNFTASECQGVCTSQHPGFSRKPCFWGPLAATECPAFERKHVLPTELPTKAAR
jgi:hypothetical protein